MRGGRSDLEGGTAAGELVSIRERSNEVGGELSGKGEEIGIPSVGSGDDEEKRVEDDSEVEERATGLCASMSFGGGVVEHQERTQRAKPGQADLQPNSGGFGLTRCLLREVQAASLVSSNPVQQEPQLSRMDDDPPQTPPYSTPRLLRWAYCTQRVATTLLALPIWAIRHTILPRPRPSWSLAETLLIKFTRRVSSLADGAGVEHGTRDPRAGPSGELKETRFEWVPGLREGLRKGVVDDPLVEPLERVGTYVWESRAEDEDGKEERAGRFVGVFLHGGGYTHFSAHEESQTSSESAFIRAVEEKGADEARSRDPSSSDPGGSLPLPQYALLTSFLLSRVSCSSRFEVRTLRCSRSSA